MQASTSFSPLTRAPAAFPNCRHIRTTISRRRLSKPLKAITPEIADVASTVQGVVASVVASTPAPLQPVVSVIADDVASISALSPTAGTFARLVALYYLFLTTPNPVGGLIDFYITGPFFSEKQTKSWTVKDFQLRDKLGGGNFGVTYEGLKLVEGERGAPRGKLTPEQKKRRVVLKKVNLDREGVRADFLRKTGTMARGSAESGKVEAYMCSKVRRNVLARRHVAEYLGTFTPEENEQGFARGQQWLVWKFESDSTLGDACDGLLGAFPECLEEIMLGRKRPEYDSMKRDALIIKSIIRQVLEGVDKLHSMGIVHRDIKPDNLLITVDGEVKIIDFGAAADMCTGVNFNPEYGMLDPRYSPPEELIMPKGFPKAPGPFSAALLSPFAWFYGRPDLFDSYSIGVLLLQMSIPQLRRSPDIRAFNNDLRLCSYDLERWRRTYSSRYDFSLLDRNNRAGWDLATKLICLRDDRNRGRLSSSEALRHRYFLPEF